MRILVHGLSTKIKGGIESFVLGMNDYMPNDLTFDYVFEDEKGKDFKCIGSGDCLFIPPKRKMLSNLVSWNSLLKKRKDVDSVVYFNWYSMAWLFPAIIARKYGYRVIIHAHNNDLHNSGFAQRLMHSICRILQKKMTIIRLTNSEMSSRFFFGKTQSTMIYNAIDVDKFTFDIQKRKVIRDVLKIKNSHVYGFVGRISYQKNPLFLIDIFYEISKKDNEAFFLVCGDGDLIKNTKEKAKNYNLNILFLGNVSNIQDYYQAMDVFVLPSRFEGLGIVLIEAQCCGLPCITTAKHIPLDVKVTDLVEFVDLEESASFWATKCLNKSTGTDFRGKYSAIIKQTRFNILSESRKLGSILEGKKWQ